MKIKSLGQKKNGMQKKINFIKRPILHIIEINFPFKNFANFPKLT